MNLSDIFPNVRLEDAPQIIPIESHTGYVGAQFVKRLADELKGEYRSKVNIGLTDRFSEYDRGGPIGFDGEKVHPLIREFYEHTSQFRMHVKPKWHPLVLPLYWFFRVFFAERVGQFILPLTERETAAGFESYIDTIDVDHDKVPEFRAWIRKYPNTDKAVYVGVYGMVRLDIPYVHVTFALPEANVTAILVPYNVGEGDFLLTSARGTSMYGGEYYSTIVDDDENPTTPERISCHRIPGHKEQFHVYVKNGELFCTHRFDLFGFTFLTLYYELEKLPVAPQRDVKQLMNAASNAGLRKPEWERATPAVHPQPES
jgi:hypothetical protein